MAPGRGAGSVILHASSTLPAEARGKEPMISGSRAEPGQAQPGIRVITPNPASESHWVPSRLRVLLPLVGGSPGRGNTARSGQSLSDPPCVKGNGLLRRFTELIQG